MTDNAVRCEAGAARHRFALRIYWEDTDAGGIVYYANYLKFMERARTDLVQRAGVDQRRLLRDDGLMFPVRRCDIEYLRPACLEDEVIVETAVRKVGGASIDLAQDVLRHDELLTKAHVRLACIDRDGRPRRLPVQVKHAFAGMAGGEGSS